MSWEFAELFDISAKQSGTLTDGEWDSSGFWRDIPSEIRVGRMGYRTRTIKAGPRLEAEIYPIFGRENAGRARAAKRNLTPEAVQRNNEERSKRKLIQLIDANFDERDIHLTLTYLGTPPKYEQAQTDVKNFLRAVKRKREKAGMDQLKYIYTIEGNEDGTRERIHVHMVMNGGIDREELESIWAKLTASSNKTLNNIAKLMKKLPNVNLEIQGHTDDTGKEDIAARHITPRWRKRRSF